MVYPTIHTVKMSSRGGVQLVPGATELRRYLEQGLTQQQIVDAWDEASGVRVSRSAIGMAIERYGLRSAKPRPRYEDMLPWTVRTEHLMHNDARMLRLEGRRRKGGALSEAEKRWLTQWRERLEEAKAVVIYDAATTEGFFWIERQETDDDIIRRPS
jgi:hypothetical protein